MRVVRGSDPEVDNDRRITGSIADLAADTAEPVLRVWTPPRQLAFGRRDATAAGYDRARRIAAESGYEPIERSVGGSAVAYTGDTVAFGYAEPTDGRGGIDRRYRRTTATLADAFRETGARVSLGEPDRSFCPGQHSLQGTGKIAGIAQRVKRNSALVGGCVIVLRSDSAAIADVLMPVYDALDRPFDPGSVGSVESAGGVGGVDAARDAIESAFVGDRNPTTVSAADLLDSGAP